MPVPLAARSAGLVVQEVLRSVTDRVDPRRSPVPGRSEDLTPAWLEAVTGSPQGAITALTVLEASSGTAARARIAIEADPTLGLPDLLFLKLTPRSVAQQVMMGVFELGAREVLFYRALAADAPLRVPRCYGTQLDARRGRNAIVLEDLAGTAVFRDVRETCTADEAGAVADALADLHAAHWETRRFDHDLAPLVTRSAASLHLGNAFVRRIMGHLKGQNAELIPPDLAQVSKRVLLDHKETVDAFWAAEPRTVIHGDTHLGNLFFEGTTPGFLDWQAVMAGPGIRDLAYFLTASAEPTLARRIERDLVDRYGARLTAGGVALPDDPDHLWDRYRAAISEIYIAAVMTSGTGDRMQPLEVSRVGVQRAVAAVEAHDTFAVLARLAGI